jgi:hypothetical protein
MKDQRVFVGGINECQYLIFSKLKVCYWYLVLLFGLGLYSFLVQLTLKWFGEGYCLDVKQCSIDSSFHLLIEL